MACRGEIAGSWQDVDLSDVKGVVAFWAEKLLDHLEVDSNDARGVMNSIEKG